VTGKTLKIFSQDTVRIDYLVIRLLPTVQISNEAYQNPTTGQHTWGT